MRLERLTIRNYKSLRDVTFTPTPLSAVVGPNAAGKSNFADAIHFLSEVYGFGLETAIARKGGYENIALRRQRRSRAPIDFEIVVSPEEKPSPIYNSRILFPILSHDSIRVSHSFSIATKGEDIKAPFKVIDERFSVSIVNKTGNGHEGTPSEILVLVRESSGKVVIETFELDAFKQILSSSNIDPKVITKHHIHPFFERPAGESFSPQELFASGNSLSRSLTSLFSESKVHQFSTALSRRPGVPTPNPSLSPAGENLPALVDWLQRKHSKQWDIVASGMREVLPKLEEINVQYLHTKTLGLFFKEEGFGRPWSVEDVSDGTMHALAMLTAAADPRTGLLVIEEPENSVHPWILRVVLDWLRQVSESKNVILTSHSPILVNRFKPDEVWIIYREEGESRLRRLTEIDPTLEGSWEYGAFQLADFLDSGAIGQAVPGGVW